MNIYVGNLSYDVTQDELSDLFSEFGDVSSVKIITDRVTERSKGFAFVEMPNQAEAENAIQSLNEKEIKGKKIKVNLARQQ
ncbi:RNA recognition motif domain-containing protein [Chloroflexota bacterium]